MDLLNAKNNYSSVVKENCLIWHNDSLWWLDRRHQVDKGRFTPLSNNDNGGIVNFFCQFKISFRISCIHGKKFRDGILAWWLYLHRSDINSDITFSIILFMYAKRQIVVGCHVSSCLLEPLKFQPLLCRGIPLFEASFPCQCFVQDGEWAFGTVQWCGRVHLDSNDRLKSTSVASRFGRNLWIYYCCI